jgi:hypothetical protein
MAVDGHDWGLRTMGADNDDTPSPAKHSLILPPGHQERLIQLLFEQLDQAYLASGMTDAQIRADVERRRTRLQPPGAADPHPELAIDDVVDDL